MINHQNILPLFNFIVFSTSCIRIFCTASFSFSIEHGGHTVQILQYCLQFVSGIRCADAAEENINEYVSAFVDQFWQFDSQNFLTNDD